MYNCTSWTFSENCYNMCIARSSMTKKPETLRSSQKDTCISKVTADRSWILRQFSFYPSHCGEHLLQSQLLQQLQSSAPVTGCHSCCVADPGLQMAPGAYSSWFEKWHWWWFGVFQCLSTHQFIPFHFWNQAVEGRSWRAVMDLIASHNCPSKLAQGGLLSKWGQICPCNRLKVLPWNKISFKQDTQTLAPKSRSSL